MAEAQFIPPGQPGFLVDAAFSGANQMQSLMARSQQMRQSQEQADRERQIFEVGRPVMEAKANADLVIAQNTLANAKMVQNLRAKFGSDSSQAQADLEQAMQVGNYQDITDNLSKIGQKYAYFQLLPEGKPFLDTVKNYQLQFHQDALLNRHTLSSMDIADVQHQNAMDLEKQRSADLRQLYTQTGKGKSVDDRLLSAADDAEKEGNLAKAEALRQVVKAHGTKSQGPITRSGQVATFNNAIQNADTKALEAEDAGDLQEAARWHKESADQAQAKKNYLTNPAGQPPDFSHWAGGPPQGPGAVAGAGAPKPKAPEAKLYLVDPATHSLLFSQAVKTPKDQITALQQAVNDGLITADVARAQLQKMGFKPKQE